MIMCVHISTHIYRVTARVGPPQPLLIEDNLEPEPRRLNLDIDHRYIYISKCLYICIYIGSTRYIYTYDYI